MLTTTTTANRHATTRRFGTLLGLSLALCLLAATQAKRSKANTGESAKKKGVSKVTYQRSTSEESPAERDRRMYRECKGLHNAGACRGYTRP